MTTNILEATTQTKFAVIMEILYADGERKSEFNTKEEAQKEADKINSESLESYPFAAVQEVQVNIDKQEISFDYKQAVKRALVNQVEADVDKKLSITELVIEAVGEVFNDNVRGDSPIDIEEVKKYITLIADAIAENNDLSAINIMECEVCIECGTVLLPDDECYEKHDGQALCAKCSVLCGDCDEYHTEEEGVRDTNNEFYCSSCLAKLNVSMSAECEQVREHLFTTGVTFFNPQNEEYFTSTEYFEFKTLKEAEAFGIEVEKIKSADMRDVKSLYAKSTDFVYSEPEFSLEKMRNHLQALGFSFAADLHTDEKLSLFIESFSRGMQLPNREKFINFMNEKTEWNLCDCCGIIDVSSKLHWERVEWGNIGNYIALCDSCNEKTIKEYANTLNYFHPLTQQCRIVSFPDKKHYVITDDKDYENIFGYEDGSVAIVENANGDAYEVKVEEIERYTQWNEISVNGEDISFELYTGAIDEKKSSHSHIIIDDGEDQREVDICGVEINGLSKKDLIPLSKGTDSNEDGILCYVWNNDDSKVIVDLVYAMENDSDETPKYHTSSTYYDNASFVNGSDKAIKMLVAQLVSKTDNSIKIEEFVKKLGDADVISIDDSPFLDSWDLDDDRGDLVSTTWYEDDNQYECYVNREKIESIKKDGKNYVVTTDTHSFKINLIKIQYM